MNTSPKFDQLNALTFYALKWSNLPLRKSEFNFCLSDFRNARVVLPCAPAPLRSITSATYLLRAFNGVCFAMLSTPLDMCVIYIHIYARSLRVNGWPCRSLTDDLSVMSGLL
jgi:hypothetical protein